MARWIDATASQRFWQYILPAAKRMVESGEWDTCIAGYDVKIAQAQAGVDAAEPDSFNQRAWRRRLAEHERDRESCLRSRERDVATIAEGVRRKAARQGRAA